MGREVQVSIDCAVPALLARFWAQVLEYDDADPPPGFGSWQEFSAANGEPDDEWHMVVDPAGIGPHVLFHKVPEPKVVKNRVHLDIRVGPKGTPKDQRRPLVDAEVARVLAAGATHVRTDDDETDYFAVMQDPEGNEFCIG